MIAPFKSCHVDFLVKGCESSWAGLNRRPSTYKIAALTTELQEGVLYES
jgi:hypothetical protein